MSGSKAFFDTNVLLYMYARDTGKQARATGLFREYARSGALLISTQVVQEFYVAASRKLGMPRAHAQDAVRALLELPLISIGQAHITAAICHEERFGISFWDALIVAAAESGGAEILYTEDLNEGQKYGSVTALNPFRAAAT